MVYLSLINVGNLIRSAGGEMRHKWSYSNCCINVVYERLQFCFGAGSRSCSSCVPPTSIVRMCLLGGVWPFVSNIRPSKEGLQEDKSTVEISLRGRSGMEGVGDQRSGLHVEALEGEGWGREEGAVGPAQRSADLCLGAAGPQHPSIWASSCFRAGEKGGREWVDTWENLGLAVTLPGSPSRHCNERTTQAPAVWSCAGKGHLRKLVAATADPQRDPMNAVRLVRVPRLSAPAATARCCFRPSFLGLSIKLLRALLGLPFSVELVTLKGFLKEYLWRLLCKWEKFKANPA